MAYFYKYKCDPAPKYKPKDCWWDDSGHGKGHGHGNGYDKNGVKWGEISSNDT